MDISKRVIGVAAHIQKDKRDPVGIDLNDILIGLILFDRYILKSLRLQEIPFLVRQLGFDGTMALLKSTAFRIECECVCVAEIGQTTVIEARARKGALPLLSYCISAIDSGDYKKYIHHSMQVFHDIPGLEHKQVKALKIAVVNSLARPPKGFASEVATNARAHIVTKPYLVAKSLELVLRRDLGINLPELKIAVHEIDEEDIRIESNIERPGINAELAHKLIERALMGVGCMAHRFTEMKAYSALTGFAGDDLPLVHEHLNFLAETVLPDNKKKQLSRVLAVAGLPDFRAALTNGTMNIGKLLDLRQTQECADFRNWISNLTCASDAEIREQLGSVRAKLGNFVQTSEGKLTRLLVTTGIGLIPVIGTIAGVLAGAVDTFLLEKVLPKSGPLAFVNDLYNSVFEQPR